MSSLLLCGYHLALGEWRCVTFGSAADLRLEEVGELCHTRKRLALAGAHLLKHDAPFWRVAVAGLPEAQQVRMVLSRLARHRCCPSSISRVGGSPAAAIASVRDDLGRVMALA